MKEDEGAALGAALQAAASIAGTSGKKTPLESLVHRVVKPDESSRCIPDEDTRRLYRKLQARFDNLSLSMREAFALARD
jgi:sugar (pentulose or hexulose) kinase